MNYFGGTNNNQNFDLTPARTGASNTQPEIPMKLVQTQLRPDTFRWAFQDWMKHRNTPITGGLFIDGKRIDHFRSGLADQSFRSSTLHATVNHVKTQYTSVLNPFEELWLKAITKVPHPGSSSAIGGNLWLLHNKQVQVQGQHPPPPLEPVLPKENKPPPTQQQHLVLTASSILALPIELLDLIFEYLLERGQKFNI
ncbi:hypothetical protein BT69DRAFT_1330565 [Atractiella rhizophila]|nr:hypothetical protein BT69DRAFT_1330565 [Atractiella rhizophila]